jgi:hypothetical protein
MGFPHAQRIGDDDPIPEVEAVTEAGTSVTALRRADRFTIRQEN